MCCCASFSSDWLRPDVSIGYLFKNCADLSNRSYEQQRNDRRFHHCAVHMLNWPVNSKNSKAVFGVCAESGISLRCLGYHWRLGVCSGLTHPPSTPKEKRVKGWTVRLCRATTANRMFFFFHSPWQQRCFKNIGSQSWVCLVVAVVCEFVRGLILISSSLRCDDFSSLGLQKRSQDAN